jgi:transposase
MQVVYTRCCGLDVHKKLVVACLMIMNAAGQVQKEIRTFGTTTAELVALADWLRSASCTHVAIESTGVYWKPIYNLLERLFELLVVTAQHMKAISGRKTDVKDAEWIADLTRHGLLRGSFIPDAAQRELPDLTRQRSSLVQERARTVNRLQKVLEDASIKLAGVATDVLGRSARAMLEGLLEEHCDPALLADLAQGRLRAKREQLERALTGRMRPHHRFRLIEHLSHSDYLDEAIARYSEAIEERLREEEDLIALLSTIPGINRRIAESVLAEIGSDLGRFPSAQQLAAWAGMCPGNHQSAGKRKSGKTRKGSRWLRQALIEAAHGAARSKKTYFAAQYRRLAARRGANRALVAVGHSSLVIIYHVLTRKEPYCDLGVNYFDEQAREKVQRRLVQRLERLGYQVELKPLDEAA